MKRAGGTALTVASLTSAGTLVVVAPGKTRAAASSPDSRATALVKRMAVQVDPRLPATWDETGHQWLIVAARHDVILGAFSRDIAQKVWIRLPGGVLPAWRAPNRDG